MIRLLLLLIAAAAPVFAQAQNCRIDTGSGKCIFVPFDQRTRPDYAVGEVFPIYDHSMLMNIERYGLKPVDGPWRYYKAGPFIYKVSAEGHEVLEIIRTPPRR